MKRRRLGNMSPAIREIAAGLRAPGELGRAIPGVAKAQAQRAAAAKEGPSQVPEAEGRTSISTYFTKPGGDFVLYEADSWAWVNVMLLDAGPVDVGTRDKISPVNSGKGGALVTNQNFRFPVRKGERVYITANAINRVRLTIEPVPFGEQVLSLMDSIRSALRGK